MKRWHLSLGAKHSHVKNSKFKICLKSYAYGTAAPNGHATRTDTLRVYVRVACALRSVCAKRLQNSKLKTFQTGILTLTETRLRVDVGVFNPLRKGDWGTRGPHDRREWGLGAMGIRDWELGYQTKNYGRGFNPSTSREHFPSPQSPVPRNSAAFLPHQRVRMVGDSLPRPVDDKLPSYKWGVRQTKPTYLSLNQVRLGGLFAFSLTFLLSSMAATAADITEQLHRPMKSSHSPASRDEADSLLHRGEEQYHQGNSDKAVESWLEALEIFHSIGDLKAQGLTYDFLSRGYVQLGRLKEAEDAIRRRLAIARDLKDFQGQIFGLNNVGTLLLQKGEFRAAFQTFTQALEIARNLKNIEGQGLSFHNLGLASARLGDANKAIKLYETALIFRRQARDYIGEANTLNNLGDIYMTVGNYENTIGSYGAALRLAKTTRDGLRPAFSAERYALAQPVRRIYGDRVNELRAIDGLVAAHSSVGRYERAFDLLEQRLLLAHQLQNRWEELKSFQSYAQIYEQLGNYVTARNFYERAIILAQTLEDSKQEILLQDRLNQLKFKATHSSKR